jgi:hypothetical protein
VNELVIVASDLYFAAGSVSSTTANLSLPGLARLTRFGNAEPLPCSWRSWLATWLGRPDLASATPAAIAAMASTSTESRVSSDASVWLADPLHLAASLTSVHLAPQGLLRLDARSQGELCQAFNVAFADLGYALLAARAGRFLAYGPALSGEIDTTDPARCLGATLSDALPRGSGAGALRRLGSEIEMWLHEHPINARRAAAGLMPISTLWPWGGGAPLPAHIERSTAEKGSPSVAVFSDDAYVEGLTHLLGVRCRPAVASLASVAAPDSPRVVATLELFSASAAQSEGAAAVTPLRSLDSLDREWIAPALDRLARGALARCALIANDRCLSVASRDLWRLWRRPRKALAALAPAHTHHGAAEMRAGP